MKRGALLFVLLLSCTMLFAQDSLRTDTLKKAREIGVIRETIRGFDRLEDDYIEPNHYEFTVMAQVTRTFENFILSSNGQSIRLAPDSQTKIGPYFGWRWFFFGYTFDIKNIGFNQNGLRKEFDISIYSSQIGVDLFYRRTGNDYKIRDVKLGYGIDGSLFEGLPFAGVNVGITGVSAYYIFNHGRFSYPAAFAQSTCQKISCGSWLAGAGYTHNTLDMDYDELERALSERMGKGATVDLDMPTTGCLQRIGFSVPADNWQHVIRPAMARWQTRSTASISASFPSMASVVSDSFTTIPAGILAPVPLCVPTITTRRASLPIISLVRLMPT